jgi:hypothetical protein
VPISNSQLRAFRFLRPRNFSWSVEINGNKICDLGRNRIEDVGRRPRAHRQSTYRGRNRRSSGRRNCRKSAIGSEDEIQQTSIRRKNLKRKNFRKEGIAEEASGREEEDDETAINPIEEEIADRILSCFGNLVFADLRKKTAACSRRCFFRSAIPDLGGSARSRGGVYCCRSLSGQRRALACQHGADTSSDCQPHRESFEILCW